jgi:hypothetical protein
MSSGVESRGEKRRGEKRRGEERRGGDYSFGAYVRMRWGKSVCHRMNAKKAVIS